MKRPFSPIDRLALALAVIILDVAVFFLPLTGLFAAYILLARPPWFRGWIERLYARD